MKTFNVLSFFFILALVLSGCTSPTTNKADDRKDKVEMKISAAISLTDALEDIKTIYEQENDVKLTYIFGGSGKLAQQIQQGAPVDVFLSANQEWMDTLENENLLVNETRTTITGNKMVMIASKDSPITYNSIEDINASERQQVAIGNPESVPAGQYTEQLLKKLDKWDELKDQIIFAQDVRQVLTYVETGNVEIGFVYESDAITSDSIKILATSTNDLHDPIIYPAAVLKDAKHTEEAISFVEFLKGDIAQAILEKHGFKK